MEACTCFKKNFGPGCTLLHLPEYQEAVRASKQELEVQSVESRARASGKNRTTAALEERMNADPVVSNVHTKILR